MNIENMTDDEIIELYDLEIAEIPLGDRTDEQLALTALYGKIKDAQRQAAADDGQQAELILIRRKVTEQAEQQALASLLLEKVDEDDRSMIRTGESESPVFVTIECEDYAIQLSLYDLQQAYNTRSGTKQNQFRKIVTDMLVLAREVASQKRARINRTDGKNWEPMTSDISWDGILKNLKTQTQNKPL